MRNYGSSNTIICKWTTLYLNRKPILISNSLICCITSNVINLIVENFEMILTDTLLEFMNKSYLNLIVYKLTLFILCVALKIHICVSTPHSQSCRRHGSVVAVRVRFFL